MRRPLPYKKLVLAFGLSWSTVLAVAQNIPEDLHMYGEVYPNACKAAERKALQASLVAMKVPDTQALSQAIETLLCAPGSPANERHVRQMLSPKVKTTDEGTGSDPVVETRSPTIELVRELMAKGRAWRATVELHDDGISLQYAPDGACISGVTFTYRGKKWWISQSGSACD